MRIACCVVLFLIACSAFASQQAVPDAITRIEPENLTLLTHLTVNLSSASNGLTPRFDVTGTVTLGGGLTVNASGAPFPTGNTYLIIANDGTDPVVGTFLGLPEGSIITSGVQSFRISYVGGTGNDVVLTAIATPVVPMLDSLGLFVLAIALAAFAIAYRS